MVSSDEQSVIVRDLVIAVFGLNGRLVDVGNQLVRPLGLTTALWQVLGALGYSSAPLPVAHIARNMGLARQSVQRVVDLLVQRGFARLTRNPHHQRAKLVELTSEGRAALCAAEAAEAPLNQLIFERLGRDRITAALAILTELDGLIAQTPDLAGMASDDKDAA